MAKVTVIPATINPITRQPNDAIVKRRVAGYARVSTDSDEQFTSYEAQVDYYTQFIKARDDWEFVKVYTDEGISGLNTKNRDGFNQMIADALDGKFSLIVTKSVSRFARNTVDGLVTIRKLKDAGCECYFEKEQIYTFDGKGELLLTIMSSLAQEESRSISENVTWGHRKRFADGKIFLPYKKFLGYEKGPDGLPKIVPEQAEIVRRIYDLFMLGMSPYSIAKQLTEEGTPSPSGLDVWPPSTVKSILTNEKYKGDARLQKTFTVDFLQKKTKVNEGEVPQYYVQNSHEAIISPQLFEQVQEEMERRQNTPSNYRYAGFFTYRIQCAECGAFYVPRTWHSNDKYRREVWQCGGKYKGDHRCKTPHITEEQIKAKFMTAFNRVFADRDQMIQDCRMIQRLLTDCSEIDRDLAAATEEANITAEMVHKSVDSNSRSALDQEQWASRYNALVSRYKAATEQIEAMRKKRSKRLRKAEILESFITQLADRAEPCAQFTEGMWIDSMEVAIVNTDGSVNFRFRNGTEIVI